MENTRQYLWWQSGIIYQVYPRSFQDSNNDGIGDIQGIIKRLDYLHWLGINIIWLSPVYPSPMKDFGYDITDYTAIHPLFGSMDDFDRLLEELHQRQMKLVIDLVPNHTSDEHPWFKESRSSKDNPKRNWYIWADATVDNKPPNNWLSVFGGSAWEWDKDTQQYYYHAFLKEQPDLNYREPGVVKALGEIMRFWLDKGVDGFRVDVIWHLIKDKLLRNNPTNPDYRDYMPTYDSLLPVYSTDQPEVHEIVSYMRSILDDYPERMMIGEVYLPIHSLVTYYGINNNGAHLPFNFLLLQTPWDALHISSIIDEYLSALPQNGWPNWVLGNHDQPRIRSRVGSDQAKVAAILLLTLPGTPTMYYGDEIAMQDVPIPLEEQHDPQGLTMPEKNISRDPERTPMQWDNSTYSGFSEARPWLRIDKMADIENVEVQKKDKWSMLLLYKKLIALRRKEWSLMAGNYDCIYHDRQGFVYTRKLEGHDSFLIALNLSHRQCCFKLAEGMGGKVEVATIPELENTIVENVIYLSGDEGVVVRLKG